MSNNFWRDFDGYICGLAPMDGVTDAAMRHITKKYGQLDLIYTEFVSAEGLVRNSERLKVDLRFDESQRPIVAQLFGKDPDDFGRAAKIVMEMGFDGVDINMGCPAKKVADRGAGGGLIRNQKLVGEIIEQVRRNVDGKIPVSVKTRIGWDKSDEGWWNFLADQKLAAVAIHGRTLKQGYMGKADWGEMKKMAEVIKAGNPETVVLGNGDVDSMSNFKLQMKKYSVFDGGLIGRASFGNPWIFKDVDVDEKTKLQVMVEHAEVYEKLLPEKPFYNMRKHLAWYARGFDRASELRQQLVLCSSADEVKKVIDKWNVLT